MLNNLNFICQNTKKNSQSICTLTLKGRKKVKVKKWIQKESARFQILAFFKLKIILWKITLIKSSFVEWVSKLVRKTTKLDLEYLMSSK